MNVNQEDFQKKLNEIGNHYEDGKDAINSLTYSGHLTNSEKIADQNKALYSLRMLRDIAAMSVKQAYQLKEN